MNLHFHQSYTAHINAWGLTPDTHLILNTDGSVHDQAPRCAAWAWIATDSHGRELAHASEIIGCESWLASPRIEYQAAIEALTWASVHAHGSIVECRTDAAVVPETLCTPGYIWVLQPLREQLRARVEAVGASVVWVPRKHNRRADRLCRQAVKAYLARLEYVKRGRRNPRRSWKAPGGNWKPWRPSSRCARPSCSAGCSSMLS